MNVCIAVLFDPVQAAVGCFENGAAMADNPARIRIHKRNGTQQAVGVTGLFNPGIAAVTGFVYTAPTAYGPGPYPQRP